MKKLRVLMITVRADFGGGPQHVYSLVRNLLPGIDVFIAAPDDYPYYERFQGLVGKERVVKIPHRKVTLEAVRRVLAFIKENEIDIIHSHGKGAGMYSRMLAVLSGRKCVHTFHGVHTGELGAAGKFIYTSIEKLLSYATDCFIGSSKSEVATAAKQFHIRESLVTIIPNGVEFSEKPWGKEQGLSLPVKVLTVTRYDYAKNTGLLIPVLLELKKVDEIQHFQFIVTGDGEQRQLFHDELVKNDLLKSVTFIGFTKDIQAVYDSADIYISTSRWEGMPLSVIEAMGSGLPVVATNVTGNKDTVLENQNGLLYSLESPAEAAHLLIRLKNDTELYRKLSEFAYYDTRGKFHASRMAEAVANAYASLGIG